MTVPAEFVASPDPARFELSRMAGSDAQRAGLSIGDCPVGAADPAGAEWRLGFIEAECWQREVAGTFGASAGEKAAAAAMSRVSDPVAEILGDYLDDQAAQENAWFEDECRERFAARIRETALEYQLVWAPLERSWARLTLAKMFAANQVPATYVIGDVSGQADAVHQAVDETSRTKRALPAPGRVASSRPGARPSRPFVCPVHGEQPAGLCRRCARRGGGFQRGGVA